MELDAVPTGACMHWAIYVVVGLGLAYMTYRKGRPLSIRWLLEPLLGRARIEGKIGHAIDVVAIVGTLFGVATSLGFGVQQISAGLDYLGWVETDNWLVITIIVIVTGMATFSVVSGVTKGLKWLSNINMMLAAALAPVRPDSGTDAVPHAVVGAEPRRIRQALPELMLRTSPFAEDGWQGAWTIFYWGWWMSWAPFVGMFIARISRGRTIREFVFVYCWPRRWLVRCGSRSSVTPAFCVSATKARCSTHPAQWTPTRRCSRFSTDFRSERFRVFSRSS